MNKTPIKYNFNAVVNQNAEFSTRGNHTPIINSVNDICIDPQHVPKTESCNPQAKNRKEFTT